MYPPMGCTNCGHMIGDAFYIYKQVMAAEVANKGIIPSKWCSLPNNVLVGELLTQLHIYAPCCRKSIITTITLSQLLP